MAVKIYSYQQIHGSGFGPGPDPKGPITLEQFKQIAAHLEDYGISINDVTQIRVLGKQGEIWAVHHEVKTDMDDANYLPVGHNHRVTIVTSVAAPAENNPLEGGA